MAVVVDNNTVKIMDKQQKLFSNISITNLVAIVTVCIAVSGYFAVRDEIKETRSMEIIKLYYSKDMIKDDIKLTTQIANVMKKTVEQTSETQPKTEEVYKVYYKELEKSIYDSNILGILHYHLNFFDMAAACISNSLCDKDIINALFKGKAKDIYASFYPYICIERERNRRNDLWASLEAFLYEEEYIRNRLEPNCRSLKKSLLN